MELHTLTPGHFSSMKKFTERVFSVAKKLRAAGEKISDAEINGVLHCGIDQELYVIQLDKWTSDDAGEKFTPAEIVNELILLKRDIEKRRGSAANGLLAAQALLVRSGFTVNQGSADSYCSHPPNPYP